MIVFLTLCYAGLVALLIKFKVIKPSMGWKLSPVLFMLLGFVLLVFPMQWGAPSGTVNVFRHVIEVVPNVSGEVIEVAAKPLEPMKKGDVLFRIDPRQYQAEVTRLEAALKQAQQKALMLPADLAAATSAVTQAGAAIVEAKKEVATLLSEVKEAKANEAKTEANLVASKASYDRTYKLFTAGGGAITQAEMDAKRNDLAAAEATLDVAKADSEQAQLDYGSQISGVNTIVVHAQQAYRAAKAIEIKTRLALESTIDGENTAVAQLLAELKVAKLDLEWTTVRAPQDGYVVQLALRPGQRVQNSPTRSWMAFVEQDKTRIAVWIKQYQLRHVKPGQPVNVEFKLYPGRSFSATVDAILNINATGQLQATGVMQDPNANPRMQQEFGVILVLDEDAGIDVSELPGGAIGTATIFTDHAKPTHFIRRVEIHMKSWLSYIVP